MLPPPEVLESLARSLGLNIPGPALAMLVESFGGGGDQVSVSSAISIHRKLDGLSDSNFRRLFVAILENPKYSSLHARIFEAIYETSAQLAKE